jgi:hypothetical protein
MAVQSVVATINGQNYTLTYNATDSAWEAMITAPSTTSYTQTGHYYDVTIKATDAAGNVTTQDGATNPSDQLVVKETVAPTISSLSPSSGSFTTNNKPTITGQFTDTGSGINQTSFTLQINGGTAIAYNASGMTLTTITNGYSFSYVPQAAIPDGTTTITVKVSDNDGNQATGTDTFQIDTVKPSLNVTAPTNNLVTNQANQTVSGTTSTANGGNLTVTIKVNGTDQGAVTLTSGNFSKAVTLTNGANTIVITSTDQGGQSTNQTITATLDTTAPTITGVTITPNPVNTGSTFTIKVVVSD